MSADSEYDLSQLYEGKSVPTYASGDTSDRPDELTRLRAEVESLRKQIVGQPDWRKRSDEIHREFIRRAPNPWEPYSTEDIRFLGLAIAGEVGELANFIKKKFWHGDDIAPQEFIKELADIRIYLELLSRCFYCDLDEACAGKLDEVQARLDRAMEKAE